MRCALIDREGLKRDVGGKVIFHGAGGGSILGPCHNIQAMSPPENIIAMCGAGYEPGWR